MKNIFPILFLLLLLTSCTPELDSTISPKSLNRQGQENFAGIDLEMSIYKQTKHSVGVEITINNNSEEYLAFHPLDFYYNPADYSTRIYAYEPDYLMDQLDDPDCYFQKNEEAYRKVENIKEGNDVSFLVTTTLLSIAGIPIFADNNYPGNHFKREVKLNDYYKILGNELLLPQSIAPGESIQGLIFFPKVGLKKLDAAIIKWRIGGDALRTEFSIR